MEFNKKYHRKQLNNKKNILIIIKIIKKNKIKKK